MFIQSKKIYAARCNKQEKPAYSQSPIQHKKVDRNKKEKRVQDARRCTGDQFTSEVGN